MKRLSGHGATTSGATKRMSRWKNAPCGRREPLFVSIEPLSVPKCRREDRKTRVFGRTPRLFARRKPTEGHTKPLHVSACSKFVRTKPKNVSTKTLPVRATSTDARIERLHGTVGRTEPSSKPRDVSPQRHDASIEPLDVTMERLDGRTMSVELHARRTAGHACRTHPPIPRLLASWRRGAVAFLPPSRPIVP